MFLGSVPIDVIQQLMKLCDFRLWSEVYVCCSGAFRVERSLIQSYPGIIVRSNDVSIFSTALAKLALGEDLAITFKDKLDWIEETLETGTLLERTAAVMVAFDMTPHMIGKPNRFKEAHLREYRRRFPELVRATMVKIEGIVASMPIASYHARDWVLHANEAMAKGAGIAAFPPTYAGGYERQFKLLNENVAWAAPEYEMFDPKTLSGHVNRIHESGVPYCIFADQHLEGLEPVAEYRAGRMKPVMIYARAVASSYRSFGSAGEPFRYKALDLSKVTKDSKITVVDGASANLTFLKNIYLSKKIIHSSGRFNFLVYVDDMLAGAFIYDLAKFGEPTSLYLLSDFATTRQGRISKMIARIALSREVVKRIEHRTLQAYTTVATTAFTKNAVSMKYRGVMEVTGRKSQDGESWVQYAGKVHDVSLSDIWRDQWNRHLSPQAQAQAEAQRRKQERARDGAAGGDKQEPNE